MIKVHCFTFNPFQENTYILINGDRDCIIVDPGCSTSIEQDQLSSYIAEEKLTPKRLINTHCHIDHVFGNRFISDMYDLDLEIHEKDLPTLMGADSSSRLFNIAYDVSPEPEKFLSEGDIIEFGDSKLKVLFVPGHAPGHIALVSEEQKFLIGGDVLFQGSIGRTDLPGGDYETLLASIQSKVLTLTDEYQVFPGHGSPTTVGDERESNPFLG